MDIRIPEKRIPKQFNLGELFGDFWASFNLDLTSSLGRVKISQRTAAITTSATVATLINPAAIVRSKARAAANVDEWWALCNQVLVRTDNNTDPSTAYAADNTANSPTTNLSSSVSDMVDFSGNLIVTLLTDISRLVAGTWTASWWVTTLGKRAMATGIPHPLKVIFNNLLLIGDQVVTNNEAGKGEIAKQPSVHTIDTASNVSLNRLLFPAEFKVIFIITTSTDAWIGCSNILSENARMFRWDGSAINYNNSYRIPTDTVLAGVVKDDIPYVVNGDGRLLKFNGNGFAEEARLPIANEKKRSWTEVLPHKNGIAVIAGKINMLIGAGAGSTIKQIENMNAGIWEYDEEIGLYHKHGVTNNQGSVIDFGSPIIKFAGALVETKKSQGTFVAGASVYTDEGVSTNIGLLFCLDVTDSTLKLGYFISRKFQTGFLEEHWKQMAVIFSKLLNTTDKIYLKYRTDFKNYTTPADNKVATWASTTTFTSASSQYWTDVSVGDEIEILSGKGAGLCAKITALSLVASTWTVTIDYTATGVSTESFTLRVRNWTVLPYSSTQDYISDQAIRYQDLPISDKSTEIQFKLLMFGTGDSPEINSLVAKSVENITLE